MRYPSPPKRYAFWMENSAYINEYGGGKDTCVNRTFHFQNRSAALTQHGFQWVFIGLDAFQKHVFLNLII